MGVDCHFLPCDLPTQGLNAVVPIGRWWTTLKCSESLGQLSSIKIFLAAPAVGEESDLALMKAFMQQKIQVSGFNPSNQRRDM